MTQEQFDNHAWRKSDKVIYNNKNYSVASIDFKARLIGIRLNGKIVFIDFSVIELVKEEGK